MVLFAVQRLVFLLYEYPQIKEIGTAEVLVSLWMAIPIDVSMFCYVMIIPTIIHALYIFTNLKIFRIFIQFYFILFIIISVFVSVVDMGLYEAWGSKLNQKALSYFAYPDKAIVAIMGTPVLILTMIFIIESITAIWLYVRFCRLKIKDISIILKIVFPLITLIVLFVGMRGGVQELPINKSWSYYSTHPVLNLAAVNNSWNAFEIFVEPTEYSGNPYKYLPEEEAALIFSKLYSVSKDTSIKILNTSKPNIVFIFLESWSSDIIEAFGGEKGVSPEFTELCREGLLLSNFYSTGFRTEQGLVAIISSFPSQPKTTIVRKFGKFDKLPSLMNVLDSNQYNSTYYYAGNLEFANTGTYLKVAGFDKVYGENDLEIIKRTRWGAYDEELFSSYLNEEKIFEEPFFHMLITSTSHEPFDAPVNGGYPGEGMSSGYKNTVHYTDECLGDFIRNAKTKEWYPNTLFIITSDHGHFLPLNRKHYEHERYHIPLLLYGDVLKEELRGREFDKFCSQSDIARSILNQLDLESDHFEWSKDIFNPYQEGFAFYCFDEGFGWAEDKQILIFDHLLNGVIWQKYDSLNPEVNKEILRKGKAHLQTLLDKYIGFNNQ